ncbi:YciI family protein [Methanobacterium sp. MBAC-LM]|uniref:YciI family protein n=1 Tax=Methanobacterium sp. MBAC-LM TaxID=3412034 RepID=UPI003C728199
MCTGRLNPRAGGVIICNAKNKEEVEALIKEDPFYTNEVAEYEIIEFLPKIYAEGFEEYIK